MKKGFAIFVASLLIVAFSLGTASAYWWAKLCTVDAISVGTNGMKVQVTVVETGNPLWFVVDPDSPIKKELLALAITAKTTGKNVKVERVGTTLIGMLIVE